MPGPRDLELLFGPARAGWLPVSVRLAAHRETLDASGVLNDPLAELAEAAVSLVEPGPVKSTVRIFSEPGWDVLTFRTESAEERVIVELGDSRAGAPRFRGSFGRRETGEDLVHALLEYERCLPRSGTIEGWGSFPSGKLRRALAAVAPDVPVREFLLPWTAIESPHRVVEEVKAEVGEHHPLYRVELSIRAGCLDTDDFLFETPSACCPLAVVHVTWSGSRERGRRFPTTTFYRTWREWEETCMRPDHTEYVGG